MSAFSKSVWKSLLFPNGLILLLAALLLHSGWLTLVLPSINLLNYTILALGLLLAWRFHSSRAFFALLVLCLAEQAIAHFSAGYIPATGLGRAAIDAVGLLLPLNFIFISLVTESGLTSSQFLPMGLLLGIQAVGVAIFCRDVSDVTAHHSHHAVALLPLPGYVWFAFAAATLLLLIRYFSLHKPLESGLLWSLASFFLALHFGGSSRSATTYLAVSAITVSASIIETSYLLAYHDELTSLPSRRAFNDALARLQVPYAIAMVDIDHFKRFNDAYGHDIGDEVLKLVASRLANVTGGGQAFRCGGEEFAIIFAGKTSKQVTNDLEELRSRVETSTFRLRSGPDRRQTPRGPDRRNSRGHRKSGHAIRQLTKTPPPTEISVTVSMGIADASDSRAVADTVIRIADKALYRAKSAGRNRVEVAASRRPIRDRAAGIA